MPTNEERKALAKRLRTLASHGAADEEMVLDALDLYPGEYIEGFNPRCVERLADLIEPDERTCGLRSRFTGAFCYECTECGHGMKPDWNFCPSCGAIVIGGQPR